jgi:hypothetical protein
VEELRKFYRILAREHTNSEMDYLFLHSPILTLRLFTHLHTHTHTHILILPYVRTSVAVAILWLSICAYIPMLHTLRACHLYTAATENISLLKCLHIVTDMKYILFSKMLYNLYPHNVYRFSVHGKRQGYGLLNTNCKGWHNKCCDATLCSITLEAKIPKVKL